MQSFENEQWRDVEIVAGYQVSDHGRVKSRRTILKPMGGEVRGVKRRPPYVRLFPDDGRERFDISVLVLVATAFLGPAPEGHRPDHIDGDRLNLHVSNIHYITEEAYRLANPRPRKAKSGLGKAKKPKAPPQPKAKVMKGPTPEEAAMIAALQVRDRKEKAERMAKRYAENAIMFERRKAKRLIEKERADRVAERMIRKLQADAERQEKQARKEEARRNTRPAISPRVWRGRHEEFAAIWSETPLTIDLRMDGDDAILIDADGKTRRMSPGDLFAAYQGRIVRKAKTPHE